MNESNPGLGLPVRRRAEALVDKLTSAPWELQEFMRSPYDMYYIGEFAYNRQTLVELHAHLLITDDPRARWLSA